MTPATPRNAVFFVIVILGLVAVGGLGGIVWLASTHTQIPTVLDNATVAAISAVSALLVSTRTVPNDPAPQGGVTQVVLPEQAPPV